MTNPGNAFGTAGFLRGLYLITPDEPDTGRLLARVQPLLPHIAYLQYRNKAADARQRRVQAAALVTACRAAGVPLIVNDEASLVAEVGADGVHLGAADGSIAAARGLLGARSIIGVSCYDDLARAREAAAAGASYLAFGAFHTSPTKPDARRAALAILREARPLGLPLVAIGGITPDNARLLLQAGADALAVISGVFAARDPLAALAAYRAAFQPLPPDAVPT